MTKQGKIIRYEINGARRLSNYVWGSLMCLGGAGFLLTGLSSYFNFQLFPFLKLSMSSRTNAMDSNSEMGSMLFLSKWDRLSCMTWLQKE